MSAILLQDENTAIGTSSKENDDDPYEKLGRCNSFTPKTRAEKTKERVELKAKIDKDKSEEDEKDERDNKEDETPFPYVGKNNAPMPMSSFNPGASMRKKQQRTSMKKPKVENAVLPSETHEEVKITPKPSKKEMKVPSEAEEANGKLLDDTSSNPKKDKDDVDDGYEPIDKKQIEKEETPPSSDYEKVSNVLDNKQKHTEKETNYADIEIIKDDSKPDKPVLLEDGTGNYTDVIICLLYTSPSPRDS